jgi:hypothetical protein
VLGDRCPYITIWRVAAFRALLNRMIARGGRLVMKQTTHLPLVPADHRCLVNSPYGWQLWPSRLVLRPGRVRKSEGSYLWSVELEALVDERALEVVQARGIVPDLSGQQAFVCAVGPRLPAASPAFHSTGWSL